MFCLFEGEVSWGREENNIVVDVYVLEKKKTSKYIKKKKENSFSFYGNSIWYALFVIIGRPISCIYFIGQSLGM